MQSIRFILVSLSLAQGAGMAMNTLTTRLPYYAITRYAIWYENQKTPVGNKNGNVFPEQMQCYKPPGVKGSHVTKQ